MRVVFLLLLGVLLFLNGCALGEKQVPASTPLALAESYLKEGRRKQLSREKRMGLLLAAAHISWSESSKEQTSARARQIYNTTTAEVAVLFKGSPGSGNTSRVIRGPDQDYRVSFAPGNSEEGIWNPDFFKELLLPEKLRDKSLHDVVNRQGFGGILVGVHKPQEPRKWLLPRIGVSAPVTAITNFDRPSAVAPVTATITLYDPTKRNRVRIADRERSLTADFGAPLSFYPDPWLLEYAALIDSARYEDIEGLYFVQPYDPDKIPVVLVHGLMSIPQMWLPIMNEIERDPQLRGKFQFWAFGYPTGDPEALLALGLRKSLQKAYEIYPRTKDMVMVSYSLGGLVGKMQVQTTDDTVWRSVFKEKAANLWTQLPSDSLVKQSLIFEANPRIKRIVFICTPHLGSSLASGPLGRLGSSIILLPAQVVRAAKSLAMTTGEKGAFPPNSISGLSPKSPLLQALYPLPIRPPFHSIIGNRGLEKIPLKDSSDGVVPYSSSHLAGAVSERIVPAQHVTACQNAETVEELKRILRLHLSSAEN
jgi:hypothetical protein